MGRGQARQGVHRNKQQRENELIPPLAPPEANLGLKVYERVLAVIPSETAPGGWIRFVLARAEVRVHRGNAARGWQSLSFEKFNVCWRRS